MFAENGLKPSVALDLHINIVFQLNEEEKTIQIVHVACYANKKFSSRY